MVLLILAALATAAQGRAFAHQSRSLPVCPCTRQRGVQPRHRLQPHLDQLLRYSLRLTVKQTPSPQRTYALAPMARRKWAPTAPSTPSRPAHHATMATTYHQRTTVIRTSALATMARRQLAPTAKTAATMPALHPPQVCASPLCPSTTPHPTWSVPAPSVTVLYTLPSLCPSLVSQYSIRYLVYARGVCRCTPYPTYSVPVPSVTALHALPGLVSSCVLRAVRWLDLHPRASFSASPFIPFSASFCVPRPVL